MGYDPSGFAAMAIYKDIYGSLSSPLSPGIGGGRSVAGLVVCAAVTYLITTSPAVTDSKPIALPFPNAAQRAKERALAFSQAKAEEREKAIAEESKKKNQAYFPLNPYEFMPVGLIMSAYPGTKNGRIIQWKDPITKVIMFEWDEAFDQGPHYHALIDKKLGLHDGNHYLPGDKVPEPLNTIYFGGYYGN